MRLQNPMWFGVLAVMMGLVVAAGCGDDDDDQSPVVTPFNFTIENLPRLASNQYYEAWVAFPAVLGRELHGDDIRESLGQFIVTQSGAIESRSGGPATFSHSGSGDVNRAARILITVETHDDTATGTVILGGDVVGDDDEGRSTLDISHEDAVGQSFDNASGSFILATPTDGAGTNENHGIWFADSLGTPALALPDSLAEGWIYHAYVLQKHAISIGTFTLTNVPDSDGPGEEAGPMPGFNTPGSDYLQNRYDLADGATEAFVVIQPAGFIKERGAQSLHDGSFPMRVLETTIPLGAPPHQSINLGPRVAPWPTAQVTFPR